MKEHSKEIPKKLDNPRPYVVDDLRYIIKNEILSILPPNGHQINIIEAPEKTGFDYGVNMSAIAKEMSISPAQVMSPLIRRLEGTDISLFQEIQASGSFLNLKIDMSQFGNLTINQILEMKADFGKENIANGLRVIIDMSSPNIAKRMSYGHLRSTIIGDALANLYKSQGYEVIRDNHLGDWGTQFGNLIVAINKWGNQEKMLTSDDPIGELNKLYVKFHKEVEIQAEPLIKEMQLKVGKEGIQSVPGINEALQRKIRDLAKEYKIPVNEVDREKALALCLRGMVNTPLEDEGRKEFLKLERGDVENKRLWELCVELSMKEFNLMYEILGVSFEETLGESFYEDQLENVIDIVKNSSAGEISEGALVVNMEDKGLGVSVVQKSDGASLYLTRDIACAIYREEKMGADKVVYVVGEDQKQYFQQLFELLRRIDYKIGDNAEHVYFGMVALKEGKMSTRKDRVILLKDVIDEGIKRAGKILEEKNPKLNDDELLRDRVIQQIAIGALKWNDLSQDPKKQIVFDWEKALNFNGNSASYVQYTAVRANNILSSTEIDIDKLSSLKITDNEYGEQLERSVIRQLSEFPNIIKEALKSNSPAKIASYVYELSKRFNTFYGNVPVLKAETENLVKSRLKLVAATVQVITNSLAILGIEIPKKM